MGSNGSFVHGVTACEDGRRWKTIGESGKVQILQLKDSKANIKLPEESHTPGRVYAIFKRDGSDVKCIAQYGRHGQKIWEIHVDQHHYGDIHYHRWEDKGNGKRGENKKAYMLTKRMRKLLRKIRNFEQ